MVSHNGNKVPNQFILTDKRGNRYFQSYDTIIAKIDKKGSVTLDKEKWDCSATTSKYRNLFLGEDTKETKEKIKNKIYKLKNLNVA
jgi:hypothetical protein